MIETRRSFLGPMAALLSTRWISFVLAFGLILAVAVLVIQLVLGLGAFERTQAFKGPFAAETAGSKALVVLLNRDSALRYMFSTKGDTSDDPFYSPTVITANGTQLGPAHSLHDSIRTQEAAPGAFSHWGNYILFSLPRDIANDASTTLLVRYGLILRSEWIEFAFLLAAITIILLGVRLRLLRPQKLADLSLVGTTWYVHLMLRVGSLVLLGSLAYLGSIAFGQLDGWSLPTEAIFAYAPWLRGLAEFDSSLPHLVLLIALVGALLSWTALLSAGTEAHLRDTETRLVHAFNLWGLPILVAWFLFSVAGAWVGIPRPQDLSGNAVAGLVPFNDATGHFAQTFEQAIIGHWGTFASRRPLAAALRGAAMFLSGYSNVFFIYLQVTLLAIASFAATSAVMRWRGPWAGLTFLGLTTIMLRAYLPTNLTEPLGILLALVSIPYLVRALAAKSLIDKGASFLFTNFALSIRMGNMFAIPTMALWMLLTGRSSRRSWWPALLAILGAIVFVMALNAALSKSFGSTQGEIGSNFAYTFCGLTHNANWTACDKIYADELSKVQGGEASVASVLYQRGFEKLVSKPWLLAERLVSNTRGFVESLPRILLQGYTSGQLSFFPEVPWLVAILFGLVRLQRHRGMSGSELLFWGLFGTSMLASASVVFADDGIRVLCASYPVLFLIVASAFVTRTEPAPTLAARFGGRTTLTYATAGTITLAILAGTLILPSLAYQQDIVGGRALQTVAKTPDEDVYLASRYMTGFLVVPDGAPMRKDVAAIPYRDYRRIIENSQIEQYEKIVTPPPPFGVVAAPGLVANGGGLLIVPEAVLTDQKALGWKVTYSAGTYFRQVNTATAIYSLTATVQ